MAVLMKCGGHGLSSVRPLPYLQTLQHFSLYLVQLIQQDRSVSTINSAIYGASWVHKESGYKQLSDHPLVQQVAEAARRILATYRP